jgi:hypothetical protein
MYVLIFLVPLSLPAWMASQPLEQGESSQDRHSVSLQFINDFVDRDPTAHARWTACVEL